MTTLKKHPRRKSAGVKRRAGDKLQATIAELLEQWGDELPEVGLAKLEVDVTATGERRLLARVVTKSGEAIDPVVILEPSTDPRVLWFPGTTFLFDNVQAEAFHTLIPRLLAGGEVEAVEPSRFVLPKEVRAQTLDLMGPGGLDFHTGKFSVDGKRFYSLEACDAFGDWGELVGSQVPSTVRIELCVDGTPGKYVSNRNFLDGATVVLGRF